MSLDFYIATSKESIDYSSDCVSLEDEQQDFLYRHDDVLDYSAESIYEIDPYSDTELDSRKIGLLMQTCEMLKNDKFFDNNEDTVGVQAILFSLELLCKKAISYNQNVYAIGD